MRWLTVSLIITICYPINSWAWNAEWTHRDLSKNAAENSVLSSSKGNYLKNLGLLKHLDEEFTLNGTRNNVKDWIRQGSLDEDAGNAFNGRFYNHFHDPTKEWSQAGLHSIWPWIHDGKSAILWSLSYSDNEYAWQWVRSSYYNAVISATEAERQAYFAKTFKGLGQIIHLIQDMAQPSHVRNDPHPADDSGWIPGFEYWAAAQINKAIVSDLMSNPIFPSVNLNTTNGGHIPITQFFDTDQYDGTNPSAGLSQGLAEYTNANFASEDTITSFPYPRLTDMQYYEDPAGTWGSFYKYRKYYRKTGGGEQIEHFMNAGRLTKYLDAYTVEQTSTLGMDDKVYRDYAQKLIPRAVGYSSGLLNYFFRGKVNMGKDPQNAVKYIIKNESSEKMDGTFALYYDDASGNRNAVPGASWTLSINPNSASSPVTFTEPTSPAPKEKGKYILVFQGKLGMEEGAVVGREVKLEEAVSARVVMVNKQYGERFGEIEVFTQKGVIKGRLPSTGLLKVRAVRFDLSDRDTFVVMAEYGDQVCGNCTRYEFHKYSIDESALTLNKGVVLREAGSETNRSEEKIYEQTYDFYIKNLSVNNTHFSPTYDGSSQL